MKTRATLSLWVLLCLLLTNSVFSFNGDEDFAGIHCPEDKFVDCGDELWDLSIYGNAEYVDYSGTHDAGKPDVKYYLNSCGQGHIKRTWKVKLYNQWHSCSQYIYVEGSEADVDIYWPENIELEGCNPNTDPKKLPDGRPFWNSSDCAMLASSHRDTYYNFGSSSCNTILREWTVMDWCTYDAYRNPYKGIYKHTQTIKIVNDEIPALECPSDITVSSYNCQGAFVSVPSIVVDAASCGGEYTVKNDSPYAQSNGKDISGEYPIGATQVTYSVTYGCGHRINCKVKITVTNDKAPTPYCRGDLTVVLMGMDTDGDYVNDEGMVEVWAKDLDAGSEGVCGNKDLFFSFSEDINNDVRIFTCDDIGKNDVALYVTDKLGNQNYCTVKLDVQNNGANIINCSPEGESNGGVTDPNANDPNGNPTSSSVDSSLYIAGNIQDQFGKAVDGLEIEITNLSGKMEVISFVDTIVDIRIDSVWVEPGYWNYELIIDTLEIAALDSIYNDESKMVVSDEIGTYLIQNFFEKNKNYMVAGYGGNIVKVVPQVLDLRVLYDHVTGRAPFHSYYQYIAADLNGDKKIDFADINEMMNAIINKNVSFSSNRTFIIIKNEPNLPENAAILEKEDLSYYMVENIESSFEEADFMVVYLGRFIPGNVQLDRNQVQTRSSDLIYLSQISDDEKLKNALDSYFGYDLNLKNEMAIYPNPAKDFLNIELVSDKDENAVIQFFDLSGKIIHSSRKKLQQGLNRLNISVENIPEGIYLSRVSVKDRIQNKRVIINR
jgi:hypothetical protein